jgi:hypothetical protein
VRVILELGGNAHVPSVTTSRHSTGPPREGVVLLDACELTPLDLAAGGGYKNIVRLLMNKMGGDVLAQDADAGNSTPLHCAARAESENGNSKVVAGVRCQRGCRG